jgi:hypothetical protein
MDYFKILLSAALLQHCKQCWIMLLSNVLLCKIYAAGYPAAAAFFLKKVNMINLNKQLQMILNFYSYGLVPASKFEFSKICCPVNCNCIFKCQTL